MRWVFFTSALSDHHACNFCNASVTYEYGFSCKHLLLLLVKVPTCQEMAELLHQMTILSLVKENVPFNKGCQLAGLKEGVEGQGRWEKVGGSCRKWENGGAAGEEEEQKKGVMLGASSKLGGEGKRGHCHVTKSALFKP